MAKEEIELNVSSNVVDIVKEIDTNVKKTIKMSSNMQKTVVAGIAKTIDKNARAAKKSLEESYKVQMQMKDIINLKNYANKEERDILQSNLKILQNATKELFQQLQAGQISSDEFIEQQKSLQQIVQKDKQILKINKNLKTLNELSGKHDRKTIKQHEKIAKEEKKRERRLKYIATLEKLEAAGFGGKGPAGFFRRRAVAKKEAGMPSISGKIGGVVGGVKETMKGIGDSFKGIGKIFGGITRQITTLLPPLTAFLGTFAGFAAFGAAMLYAQKKIYDARREVMAMSAETGELSKNIIKSGGSISVAGSAIETWRRKTEGYIKSLGLGMDDARQGLGSLVKAGYTMEQAFTTVTATTSTGQKVIADNFTAMYAQATLAGKSMDEITSTAGQLREEFGSTIDNAVKGFIQFRENAKDSGIMTGRFFEKVMNVASGLGIYGAKIDEISEGFADLSKNMRLPEKAATQAAANMMGGFKDLSTETQVLVARTSTYGKKIEDFVAQIKAGGPAAEEAFKGLEKLGIDKQEAERLAKITDPLNRAVVGMRELAPAEQFKARFEALTKAAGVPIDINSTDIKDVNDILQSHTYQLEKAGEKYGFGKEDIIALQSLTQGLEENKRAQQELLSGLDPAEIGNALKAGGEEFKKMSKTLKPADMKKALQQGGQFQDLGKKFETQIGSLEKASDKQIIEFISGLDVSMTSLGDLQAKLNKEKENADNIRAAKAARQQTQSVFDALEQSIAKILNNIYLAVEPVVKTIWKMAKPILTMLKKMGLYLLKMIPLKGAKIEQWIAGQEMELRTEEANNQLENFTGQIEGNVSKLTQMETEQQRLTAKKKSGAKLGTAEETFLKNYKENVKAIEEDTKKLREDAKIQAQVVEQKQAETQNFQHLSEINKEGAKQYVKLQKQLDKYNEALARAKEEAKAGPQFIPDYGGVGVAEMTDPQAAIDAANKFVNKTKAEMEKLVSSKAALPAGTEATTEPSKVALPAGTEAITTEPMKIVPHSPIEAYFGEPAKIIDMPKVSMPVPAIPGAGTVGMGGEAVNDNRVINININQRDRQYIEQVVLNALYTDKMK